jgi:organic radical activating enzyme
MDDAFDEGALVEREARRRGEAAPAEARPRGLSRLFDDPALAARLERLRAFSKRVRTSEYHLTNACNIRCKGCWFFEYGFEKTGRENTSLDKLAAHIERETARGVNAALLIGGEPTLFPERVAKYVEAMEFVSISTNGLKPLPRVGFENVTVFVSLFGGGPLDDDLRAVTPSGRRFDGLFATSLANYRDDPRATFVYALSDRGIDHIEDAVRRIADNGNRVTFNYYTEYGAESPMNSKENALLGKAIEVREKYPETVICSPYFIETLITGRSHWGETFGYATCPSISADHPAHRERLAQGHKSLPLFNTYAADLETINFCCTSGHCDGCRDSQAVYSWLMLSAGKFLRSKVSAQTWIDTAEGYWKQFIWSPYHNG